MLGAFVFDFYLQFEDEINVSLIEIINLSDNPFTWSDY